MTEVINLRQSVPANAEVIVSDTVQLGGVISLVRIHFPPGANALVDVAVRAENEQIIPVRGFIALDDATVAFTVHRPIEAGREVSSRIRNADGANAHTITTIIEISPPEERSHGPAS